jgi:trk system potassium uptake protein TrkH
MAVSRSIFHSVSAFCNAGFSLFTTNFERYAGNIPVNLVVAALIVIGGLGFPVIMNALGHRILLRETRAGISRWSVHTRIVVRMTLALLLLGTILFLVLEWGGALEGLSIWQKILRSFFGSVTARTAGFNTVSTAQLALPTLFLLSALMFIGGSPGGTAGGVKTVTLAVVLATIKSMFSGKQGVEMLRRQIPDTIVREALVVIAVALLVVSGAIFVLLIVEDGPLSKILFEVVSAFGTVGLSTGITPGLSATGKVVLMAVMLTGRIGPLTLALAVGRRRESALYAYPEERVIIG